MRNETDIVNYAVNISSSDFSVLPSIFSKLFNILLSVMFGYNYFTLREVVTLVLEYGFP